MATSEERLKALEGRLAGIELPDIQSAEELSRHEAVRAAAMFGERRPQFRSVVRLRFHGPGVDGHDLPGHLAGAVVTKFIDAVRSAGDVIAGVRPGDLNLFLSPTIDPGSTILELYGAPRADTVPGVEPMGSEIDDTPVDLAIQRVFEVLDTVDTRPDAQIPEELRVEGLFGQRLWQLSKELLAGDVDLDLRWQSPRGRATSVELGRALARTLRDLLDRPTTARRHREADGELITISTDRQISLRPDNAKQAVIIAAGDEHDLEELRGLWARRVHVAWTETVVSHPQRDSTKVTRSLDAIRLRSPEPDQFPGTPEAP